MPNVKEKEAEVCSNAYSLNNIEYCHKCKEWHFADKIKDLECPFETIYDFYVFKEDGEGSND